MPETTGDESVDESVDAGESGGIDEVAYKLENWDDEAFVDAEEALRNAGVEFRREGLDTLIVAPGDEEVVDRLLDEVEADHLKLAESENGPMVSPGMGTDDAGTDEATSHDELIYELVDWSPEMRNELTLLLEQNGIVHEWEGDDLVVAAAVESHVDAVIDQIEQGDALPAAAEEADDEANYNLLSDLFIAADRLGGSPSDVALCGDLVDAAGPTQSMPVPFGVDDNAWRMIQQLTSSLVDAIEVEEPDEVVGERATRLADLLRSYV
jgi:hypothetical protein